MGKQITIKDGLSRVWLHRDGVYDGGEDATLTDAEYSGLSSEALAAYFTADEPSGVSDPTRTAVTPYPGT